MRGKSSSCICNTFLHPIGEDKQATTHKIQKIFSLEMGTCGCSTSDGVMSTNNYESIAKKRKESLAFRRHSGLGDLLKIKTAVVQAEEVRVYKINLLGLTHLGYSMYYSEATGRSVCFHLQKSPLKSFQARLLKWSWFPTTILQANSIRLFPKFICCQILTS